jgi:hypothetical protein
MANELTGEKRAVIYLMDAPFVRFPLNFVSSIYLAAAIASRIMQPQIYALSKTDLVTDQDVDTIIEWATEREAFAESLRNVEEQNLSMISMNLATAVFESGLLSEPIPVSSKDNSGMVELNAAVTRVLTGGEEQSS